MTNYEKIKNMSVLEMAEMLFNEANNSYNYCDYCPNQRYYAPHCAADDIETGCKNAIMQWLNEESEVKGNDAEYSERCDSSFGGKEYAKQMRENAVIDKSGDIIVSEELWQQIATIIETQQEKIERLTTLADMRINDYRAMRNKAKTARAEAIREFADRLKEKFLTAFDSYAYVTYGDVVMAIENIVKEMVGAIE